MTAGEFKKLCCKYNVPDDVKLISDSGWECDATDMDGVYYDIENKIIYFTQYFSEFDRKYNHLIRMGID